MVCSNALLAVLALATFAVGASEEAASLTHQSAANRYTHRRHSLRPPQHPRVPAVAKREEGKDIVALYGKLLPAVMPAAAAIPSNNTNRRAHLHHLAGSAIGASNAAPTSQSDVQDGAASVAATVDEAAVAAASSEDGATVVNTASTGILSRARRQLPPRERRSAAASTPTPTPTPTPTRARARTRTRTWDVSKTSIVFVKLQKVGGSTAGGVMRRVADHHGIAGAHVGAYEDWDKDCRDSPVVWAHHGNFIRTYRMLRACKKVRPVFLATWVRNPLERCLSMFYHFRATRYQSRTTFAAKRRYCLFEVKDNLFIKTVGTWEQAEWRSSLLSWQVPLNFIKEKSKPANALKLFELYDFVGVTERFDESLLVLQDVLGLDDSDILYIASKNSTAGQRGQQDIIMNRTVVPNPGILNEDLKFQQLATNPTWIEKNEFALKFVEYANAALDGHIARIGRTEFKRRMHLYKALLNRAKNECTSPTPKCYWNDNGCHYDCLDRIAPPRNRTP